MDFAIVFDLFVAFYLDDLIILEHEAIGGIPQILFFNQHALKSLGIKTECGTALQPLFVGIAVDILEIFIGIIGRHIGRF